MNTSTKRTNKVLALIVAAMALLAIAPTGASAAKTIKSDVGLNLQYQPAGNGVAQGFLYGTVTADNPACLNTTVHFSRQKNFDPNTWEYGWRSESVTAADSGFTVYLASADRGYQYTINTGKQVIRKGKKKIVCDYGAMYDVVDAK